MNRRQFLKTTSASGFWLGMHGNLALGAWMSSSHIETIDTARILSLKLHTSAPLSLMKNFYHGMLDFPVAGEALNQISFRAGSTNLTFAITTQNWQNQLITLLLTFLRINLSLPETGRPNVLH